jgi:PTS system fructose-specific IIC component
LAIAIPKCELNGPPATLLPFSYSLETTSHYPLEVQGSYTMSEHLMTPDLVRIGVTISGDKYAVIDAMADVIARTGRADKAGLVDAMTQREHAFATGMPGGIAIPHCRTSAVREPALGFLKLDTPIDFGAKDGPADIVIGIAAPEESGSAHMKLLAKLSRALVRPGFVDSLRSAATPQEVVDIVMGVVEPPNAGTPKAAAKEQSDSPEAPTSDTAVLLAITSCPTGIAHTYMAAEALENAAKEKGVELHVETQGSGGIEPFTPAQIARAGAIIIAADVGIQGRERFTGMPVIESGVKRPMSEAAAMIDEAIAAAKNPHAKRAAAAAEQVPPESGHTVGWGKRIQQALMTGVSYMIPFVAAGGLLIALGFLFGGYTITSVAADMVQKNALWNLPDLQAVFANAGVENHALFGSPLAAYLGAVFYMIGSAGMGFLVATLSGYIAFGIAGRPGIAPGFIGGAIAVTVGAGFIGGLVTGILAGIVAYWFTTLKPPRWLAGLMPVVIIPLLTTALVGGAMLLVLGRPLKALMDGLQNGLGGMTGSSAVILGIILGLMMCFDLGGPVNKAAYLFATAGLAAQTQASWEIMAAVMAAGMVPPLAMALSTAMRPKLYTQQERENGTAAWLLGLSFISEGAIPFAAADPFRVIPSMMVGGAVTGALSMALKVGSHAPHGGIFVFFAIDNFLGFLIAIAVGMVVAGFMVTALKQMAQKKTKEVAV